MNFKDELKKAYDADALRREQGVKDRDEWKLKAREGFANRISKNGGKSILEIGAGVGHDSLYFKERGFEVLAVDLSEGMVESCKKRGLTAKVMDVSEIGGIGRKFDGIYSMNVMLHVSNEEIESVLESIKDALNKNGLFYYGSYGNKDEVRTIIDKSKMGMPRKFFFRSDETLQKIVGKDFEIVEFKKIELNVKNDLYFQSLLLKRKED